MKKFPIIGIILALQLAFAMIPASALAQDAYSTEAKPPITATETTPEEPAVLPASSQEETVDTASTVKKTQQEDLPDTGEIMILPEPELPVLNLDDSSFDSSKSLTAQYSNVDTDSIAASIIGPYLGNQISIVLVVFLCAIAGSILAMLGLILVRMIGRHAK